MKMYVVPLLLQHGEHTTKKEAASNHDVKISHLITLLRPQKCVLSDISYKLKVT